MRRNAAQSGGGEARERGPLSPCARVQQSRDAFSFPHRFDEALRGSRASSRSTTSKRRPSTRFAEQRRRVLCAAGPVRRALEIRGAPSRCTRSRGRRPVEQALGELGSDLSADGGCLAGRALSDESAGGRRAGRLDDRCCALGENLAAGMSRRELGRGGALQRAGATTAGMAAARAFTTLHAADIAAGRGKTTRPSSCSSRS